MVLTPSSKGGSSNPNRNSNNSQSLKANTSISSNPASTNTPTPLSNRASQLANLSHTPSARSSMASTTISSTNLNPSKTAAKRTSTLSNTSSSSRQLPPSSTSTSASASAQPRPRSRFNSVNSLSSATSNSNHFTPNGRKLINSNLASSTSTTQRLKLANAKLTAMRDSPSKSNQINVNNNKASIYKGLNPVVNKNKTKSEEVWLDNEPIKAFLRIKPAQPGGKQTQAESSIQILNETDIIMSPPEFNSNAASARSRSRPQGPSTKYSFTKVFYPSNFSSSSSETSDLKPLDPLEDPNSQPAFFKHTTLPMVKDLLDGRSGLVFTYGVTNSGKSYTVQGERGEDKEGILPRALDTVFNSIEGLGSESEIRPTGLIGVETAPEEECSVEGNGNLNPFSLPGISERLTSSSSRVFPSLKTRQPSASTSLPHIKDATILKVDRNLRYSVWVSYVEVYNEKFFDLLDVAPETIPSKGTIGGMTRSTTSNWSLAARNGGTSSNFNADKGITLQRNALSLKKDPDSDGKYVSGLREIRVRSTAEAQELLQRGQENRAVFGTMANRASSRSHGIFTIKLIREHNSKNPDESIGLSCSTSRLNIVDLAGSERVSNTGTGINGGEFSSNDRLKEAGNINKSLMCLGQCLLVLRQNQQKAVNALAPTLNENGLSNPMATIQSLKGSRPEVVPFSHSKLTTLFQSFFLGDEAGRAVMIVNVNPWDTGFDENSHVLKFSAVAQEVGTTATIGKNRSLASPVKKERTNVRSIFNSPNEVKNGQKSKVGEIKRKDGNSDNQVETEGDGVKAKESDITIIEVSDGEDDEDETDPFVQYLVQKHEELRQQLFEAQMRCSMIEAEVRDEMADEMDEHLQEMERMYNQRALNDAEQHELLANRKLDLLSKFNHSQRTPRVAPESLEEEGEEEEEESGEEDDQEVQQSLLGMPSSPLRLSDLVINGASHSTSPSEALGKKHPLASSSSDDPADSSDVILRPGRSSAVNTSSARRAARLSAEGDVSKEEASSESEHSEDEDEDEEEEESSSHEVSQSESEEGSQDAESEFSGEEENEEEEEEEEEVITESSEPPVVESEETPTPLPTRASTRTTRGVRADRSSSANVDEVEATPKQRSSRNTRQKSQPSSRADGKEEELAGTIKKSRSTRNAAAIANSKVSSTKEKKSTRKASSANALKERLQVEDDPSDVSLIEEVTKDKKKRKLRNNKAVDEETMLEEIADSSLVAAVKRRVSSNRTASNTSRLR